MNRSRIPGITYLVLSVILLSLLVGCGSTEEPSTDSPRAEGTAPVAETTQPEPDSLQDTTADAQPDESDRSPADIEVEVELFTPPEGLFAEGEAALAALESYRYTSAFHYAMDDGGESDAGSIDISGAIAGPDRQHLVWTDVEGGDRFEVIRIAGEAWTRTEGVWRVVPALVADAMTQAVLIYAPAASWSGLFGALEAESTYVGQETLHGIATTHYTSTYAEWGAVWQGQLVDARADVWIADAGYPAKYLFTATGIDPEGSRGTISWVMEVFDVNVPIDLQPPTVETGP